MDDDARGTLAELPDRNAGPADSRLIDQIFGDLLPDTTTDERDESHAADGHSDRWYQENRPPHHDG